MPLRWRDSATQDSRPGHGLRLWTPGERTVPVPRRSQRTAEMTPATIVRLSRRTVPIPSCRPVVEPVCTRSGRRWTGARLGARLCAHSLMKREFSSVAPVQTFSHVFVGKTQASPTRSVRGARALRAHRKRRSPHHLTHTPHRLRWRHTRWAHRIATHGPAWPNVGLPSRSLDSP